MSLVSLVKPSAQFKMDYNEEIVLATVLHWNYRGFTEFPLQLLTGEETEVTDIYLKENLISRLPDDIGKLQNLESLYLSGNDISELPKEISKLHNLKCLDLSGNRLVMVPEEIGDVRGLKFLILDENELVELPLRLAELTALRYLSVCDNNLKWLPQRPVYNYYHCELRFWRNKQLTTMPHGLWYHMFRDQQTRTLNIGCLKIPRHQTTINNGCRLRLQEDSREWQIDVSIPPKYTKILENTFHSPPSLYEICRRKFYKVLCVTCKKLNKNKINRIPLKNLDVNNNQDVNNKNVNVEELTEPVNDNANQYTNEGKRNLKMRKKYFPADLIEDYYSVLPNFIKEDFCTGPVSKCENIDCKEPVFNYAYYEFIIERIILIDNIEDVILSAVFCSKRCADLWKRNKSALPYTLAK